MLIDNLQASTKTSPCLTISELTNTAYLFWNDNGQVHFVTQQKPEGLDSLPAKGWSEQQKLRSWIDHGVAENTAPVAIEFQDKIYLFWCGATGDGIWYTSTSTHGKNWEKQLSIEKAIKYHAVRKGTSPAVAIFNNKIYLFWCGSGGDGIWYTTSQDGNNWQSQKSIKKAIGEQGFKDKTSPAVAIFSNKIYLFWCGSGKGGIWYTTSQDGNNWQSQKSIKAAIGEQGFKDKTSPAAIKFEEKLYLFWNGSGEDGFWFTSTKGDEKWTGQMKVIDRGNQNKRISSPAVATSGSHLFLCWGDYSRGKIFWEQEPYLRPMERSKWMEEIFQDKKGTRMHEIFIPGTHDSATYGISENSGFADVELEEGNKTSIKDVKYWSDKFSIVFDIFSKFKSGLTPREIVAGWAKAQNVTIKKQLETGIRFFDLRPCVKNYSNPNKIDWWISHSLFSVPLDEVLRHIRDFLNQNSYEIVILDLRYIWGLSKLDRTAGSKALYQTICDYLGEEKLIKLPPNATTIPTISKIWETSGRVLLLWNVCENPKGSGVCQEFMKEQNFQNTRKWADLVGEGDKYNASDKKIEQISKQLKEEQKQKDFCLVKCEIDPEKLPKNEYITNNLAKLADSNKRMITYIQDEWSKRRTGCVFTFDFYDNCGVADTIIKLNE